MIHRLAFYKLLGIPESVEEPTAYHLLGLDPRMVTEALIDTAVTERKLKLRQEIPGPQFIPVVERIEQELEQAAATLRDPRLRQAYNERLLEDARLKKKRQETEERSRLVLACREAVRSMVDEDGCLPSSRRGELAGRLERLGLPAEQVRYVLGNIPLPPEEATASSDEDSHFAREQAMQFFLAAIDLEISRGLLGDVGERKLMTLAAKFNIAPHVARRSISSRLMAVGAQRGTRDESNLAAQFKLHVLAMFPTGEASDLDRRRLLALATAQGLSMGEAQKVLDDYLGRASPAPAGGADKAGRNAPQDPLPILKALAGQTGQEGAALTRYTIVVVTAVVAATLLMGVYAIVRTTWPGLLGHAPVAAGPDAGGAGGAAPAVPVEPTTSAAGSRLLGEAVAALAAPAKVRALFRQAHRDARTEALAEAAKVMLAAPTPREQAMLEGVFRCLLGCPAADGEVQNDAIAAPIRRLAAAAAAPGGQDLARPGAQRLAALLASTLFLRSDPGFVLTDPEETTAFLTRCRRAWDASRKDCLIDPVNDPKRLAAAATAEGSLAVYAQRADGPHFKAVCEEVAAQAADPARPGSQVALEALEGSADGGGAGPDLQREARLALCTVLEQTSDLARARRARAILAGLVDGSRAAALRDEPVATPQQRKALAQAMRQAVNAPPPRVPAGGATRPATQAATAPATRPAQPPPVPDLTGKVRAACGKGGTPAEALAGLAVTMLALADRAEQWTGNSQALTAELRGALTQPDQARRVAWLTRTVKWADRPKAEAVAAAGPGPAALGPEEVAALEGDLRAIVVGSANRAGAQFHAVEQLATLDNEQAADMLLKRLGELLTCGPADYPMVNCILHALLHMRDPKIPVTLAEMIGWPNMKDYVPHRIVMTLMEGSGRSGETIEEQWRFHLPLSHSKAQRENAAKEWKAVAAIGVWGPGAIPAGAGVSAVPQAVWQSPKDNEKLLAVFAHYARRAGRSLGPHPGDGPKAPVPGDIAAPIRRQDLLDALDALVKRLDACARQAAVGSGRLALRADQIDQADKAGVLAGDTPMQTAAVRLGTAGRMLEMILLAGDKNGAKKESLDALRQQHERACAAAPDVLAEMQERCGYCLFLLELLRPAQVSGP